MYQLNPGCVLLPNEETKWRRGGVKALGGKGGGGIEIGGQGLAGRICTVRRFLCIQLFVLGVFLSQVVMDRNWPDAAILGNIKPIWKDMEEILSSAGVQSGIVGLGHNAFPQEVHSGLVWSIYFWNTSNVKVCVLEYSKLFPNFGKHKVSKTALHFHCETAIQSQLTVLVSIHWFWKSQLNNIRHTWFERSQIKEMAKSVTMFHRYLQQWDTKIWLKNYCMRIFHVTTQLQTHKLHFLPSVLIQRQVFAVVVLFWVIFPLCPVLSVPF